MSRWKLVTGSWMGYNLLLNRVYWGYNPFTNLLLTSWDILVGELITPLISGWSKESDDMPIDFRPLISGLVATQLRLQRSARNAHLVRSFVQGGPPTSYKWNPYK